MMESGIEHILAARRRTHGDFGDHSRITQNLKAMMVDPAGASNWNVLSARAREALEMIQHKIGRILAGDPNEPDHWRDIAGYATLVADHLTPPAPPQTAPRSD